MGLGFTRQEVIAELDAFNGDKNQAMAALFAKSFKIPTMWSSLKHSLGHYTACLY